MKTINDYKYSQRAVAPIIATLLMVAISVVGGILIFVFAQGFFTDTNIQSPNIESIEIFGYDARDVAAATGMEPHNSFDSDGNGVPNNLMTTVGSTVAGVLGDADEIVIYIRNKGSGPVTIDTIRVYGTDYRWAGSAALADSQEFSISTNGDDDAADMTTSPVLEAGQEATVIIVYESDTNGSIKIGRPIPIVLVTGSGATFTKQLQNGVQVG